MLGAAAQDLYEMQDFETAVASGQKLIDRYPAVDVGLRRSAWTVVAHSSFELGEISGGRARLRAVARVDARRR